MRNAGVLMLVAAIAGCASTGPGDNGIGIDTVTRGQALPGANCTVSTGAGNWSIVTPAVLAVGPASGDLRILCNRQGYRSSEVLYRPSSPNNSSIGIGIGGGGGNVGIGLGFGFPIAIGGGRYPSQITVDMTPQ
jgi:hypothetical protein